MLAIVLYIIVPLLCLIGIKYDKDEKNILSKDDTLTMRGIGMLFIVFTHMVKGNICPSTYFFYVSGGVGVAICFLVSGYGLHVSFKKKSNYLHPFWGSKILRLLVPFIVIYIMYLGLSLVRGDIITLAGIVKDILTVTIPGVTFWYLKIQLLLYVIFYVSYRLFSDVRYKMISVVVLTIIYVVLAKICGLELFWYNSCLFFALGLYVAEYQDKILYFLRNKLVFVINSLFCMILYLVLYFFGRLGIDWLFDTVYMMLFCGLALWLVQKWKESVVLRTLGYYSIEVYLIHTVIGGYFDAIRPINYILLPLVSFCIGMPVHWITTRITSVVLNNRGYNLKYER